jgi:hypothetical protein
MNMHLPAGKSLTSAQRFLAERRDLLRMRVYYAVREGALRKTHAHGADAEADFGTLMMLLDSHRITVAWWQILL